MKYTISVKKTLSLAAVILFSIACQGTHSSSNSVQATNAQGTPAPSSPQSGATNSPANPLTERIDPKNATKPSIEITEVPTKGAGDQKMETIAGAVSGVKINECKVVLFAYTNLWYVQPYIGSSDTTIKEDYTWRNETFLGSRYAALLVKNSYNPPSTTGKLPAIGGQVLAIAIADAKQ